MFHKIRLRLTLLSGTITTLILIIMTLGYLYISEKNLMQNKTLSWQNDISSVAFNLEQQSVITHAWLANLEGSGNYYVSVLDNNTPFLFNGKSHEPQNQVLFDTIWDHYRENSNMLPENILSYRSYYKSFPYQGEESYYCFVITLDKDHSALEMLLVSPLSAIYEQIKRQRFVFTCIIATALVAIWLFSWFFTGKLLYPIEENRQKQNHFIAAASHELRTPLAVILTCTESSLEKVQNNDQTIALGRDLTIVKNESLRMSALLEDLLTLSSSDSNCFTINKAPVELDTLLLNTFETFEVMAHAKNITLSISLPDKAVPLCCCDQARIQQVLVILLHNANSYTPNGGKIMLSIAAQNKYCILTVSDTGSGIPDEEKDKIFDRFYRSEKSRSAKGHFGLGLSIAYEIVMAHHGTIAVQDNTDGGAMFVVRLPIS